ncbi:DinB family protein [Paenibacillus aestuarii]|uniref:DinB family protein n=1 Tax=Paenibacillus aestuarii TaxID=516965 RepID=A0ABW0KGB8_9BACL|nr:DinB family protein [Paenibacillus aestuarii]
MSNIEAYVQQWLSHRKVVHQMLEEVNSEQLQFKPWENGMSFSQLVQHITNAMGMFATTVKNGTYTPGAKSQEFRSVAELQAKVAADTEQTEAILRSLTAEDLERPIEFFGHTLPGSVLLQNAKDHEIHHKGQLFIYLRLLGIEKVPFFVSRG